jgi:putative ABC transport system substrate-binding protein
MRRRESILFVGSKAAWPLAARVQQPVVGFLDLAAESKNPHAFNRCPADTVHVAGRSVAIEFRSTDGQCDRFPDLVRRNVAAIATSLAHAGGASSQGSHRDLTVIQLQ